ncbi:hypothetical protein AAL_01119 [Moelleriella libera RCEF 2490]|uniref:Ubiquitin-protein ligase (Asi3) n=1 Tax=Moelleriella libera RCEF 2490 TaxID=1081109 RepID=A0A166VH00_9HYPO|nr:hypothetical protein AAL_01119 [Moelleriella libera RCEF 2490]
MTRRASNVEDFMLAGPQLLSSLGSFISPLSQLPWRLASNSVGELSLSPDAHIYPILEPQDNIFNGPKTERLSEGFGTAARGAALPTDNGARSLGSVFSYATSKWAVSCIAMAIILNRTRIFAATRRRLRLRWHTRLLLRGLPVVLLALQAIRILQSIQCQTSSDFSQLRWADRDTTSDLAYAFPIAWFNRLSSALLFGATDRYSCQAVSMIPNLSTPGQLHGSLSLLWPSFGVMCLSQFTETLSCAVQGRPPSAETGMTLFEQSLAFAEADAAISYHFGWRSVSTIHDNFIRKAASMPASMSQARSLTLSKVNTPPEVLVVAFLSTMSHLFSHVLGIFDAQSNYRLLSTGFWGICFMATIVCNVFDFDFGNPSSQGLLRFPTVCVIGFVPHVLILAGTIVCSMIYAMSLILSAAAPPVNAELSSMTLRQRLAYARSNMQANLSLAEIRISRDMDFYTALLRTGFAAITMASEAVYLNEEQGVHTQRHTWLEELRLRELEDLRTQSAGLGSNNAQQDQVGMMGLVPVIPRTSHIACGYSRERAAQKICRGRSDSALRAGTGASERSSRWLLAVAFVWTVMRFLVRISALVALWTFSRVHLRYQPSWLLWLSRQDKCVTDGSTSQSGDDVSLRRQNSPSISYEGQIPRMEGIDVEQEFRQINQNQGEESLDSDLYKYWISGGWWGTSDGSGNYVPEVCDEGCDASSVISSSSLGIDEEGPSECHDERNFDREASHVVLADISRESSPSSDTILDRDNNDQIRISTP